jgi:hypothetical protein
LFWLCRKKKADAACCGLFGKTNWYFSVIFCYFMVHPLLLFLTNTPSIKRINWRLDHKYTTSILLLLVNCFVSLNLLHKNANSL